MQVFLYHKTCIYLAMKNAHPTFVSLPAPTAEQLITQFLEKSGYVAAWVCSSIIFDQNVTV